MAVTVRESHCPQNHRCPALRVCPTGALTQVGFGAPVIDAEKCTDCGRCVRVCPKSAMTTAGAGK